MSTLNVLIVILLLPVCSSAQQVINRHHENEYDFGQKISMALSLSLALPPDQCLNNVNFELSDNEYFRAEWLCVESRSNTPIHLGYLGSGVFIYDDAGYIYDFRISFKPRAQVEEFSFGVH